MQPGETTPDLIISNPAVSNQRCGRKQSNSQTAQPQRQNHRTTPVDRWGDSISSKSSNMVRICFNNLNNIGQSRDSYKTINLKSFIQRRDIDFMCMAELGVHWPSIPAEDRFWERTQSWFDYRRSVCGFNSKTKHKSRSQYGGTAILGVNFIVQKINTSGQMRKV